MLPKGSDAAWLVSRVSEWTESVSRRTPSKYIEAERYLPPSVTDLPGPMSFESTPYLVEILDSLDPDTDVREVSIIKGVQTGGTVGILESILLYYSIEVASTPIQIISATQDLVKIRLEQNILPMYQHSGLGRHIQSNDPSNKRKSGATARRLNFLNGSFLLLTGANSGAQLRSNSIRVSLRDECDTFKALAGEGDVDALADGRQASYWDSRKTVRISTPLEQETSVIYKHWKRGDQRRYYVACRGCKETRPMKWRTEDRDTGVAGGVTWSTEEDGRLLPDTVTYGCPACGHQHKEHDKQWMFSRENGAHWEATAKPAQPGLRSYHIPGMLSYALPWAKLAADHMQAFDSSGRVTNLEAMKTFYNLGLGQPWRKHHRGKIEVRHVEALRRHGLKYGEINNEWHEEHCGGAIQLLVMTVDVHVDNLAVAVWGFTESRTATLVDYWRIVPGAGSPDCTDSTSSVWSDVRALIEEKEYLASDGQKYRINLTLVDAGFSHATVTGFTGEYESGVYHILGRPDTPRGSRTNEFAPNTTKSGAQGFLVAVDGYKGTISSSIRRHWDASIGGQAPLGSFHMPEDATSEQLKELTAEALKEEEDSHGRPKYVWHRAGGTAAPNELFDLSVYGSAGLTILAHDHCVNTLELEFIDWPVFWAYLREQRGVEK